MSPATPNPGRLLALLLLTVTACGSPVEHWLGYPIPLTFRDGLLYAHGQALPAQDSRCDGDAADPPPSLSDRLLLDVATPLSVMSNPGGQPAQQFIHGQVQLNASLPDGQIGPARFVLCDVPLIRGNQAVADFRLDRQLAGQPALTSGPLAAVLGGDLFGHFALRLSFVDAQLTQPQLTIVHSDITPSCYLDDAVLPYRPAGGDLLVEVGDSVLSYSPTRITVSACVEPLADPLVDPLLPQSAQSCLDPAQLQQSLGDLSSQLQAAKRRDPVDQPTVDRLTRWRELATDLIGPSCADVTDLATLGDLVEGQKLRRPAYLPSGVNMRFLVSTAVPDLLLSQNACARLASPERCQCAAADKVQLRLPGLNGPQPDGAAQVESGCRIRLGGSGKAALALVARQLTLSPCAELARSRRQRAAPPQLPAAEQGPSDCLREACLQNLARQSSLTAERCGYTGLDIGPACDDHQAAVAGYVELGGPLADPKLGDDTIEALVLPDTAAILRSASDDLRNVTAQPDGVIGVSLLRRLNTVIDYPQQRVALSCRCDPATVCRTYRGATYHSRDSCAPSDPLVIPSDYGRSTCR